MISATVRQYGMFAFTIYVNVYRMMESYVSALRINEYFASNTCSVRTQHVSTATELDNDINHKSISIVDGVFAPLNRRQDHSHALHTLKVPSLCIDGSRLVAVCGGIGSGKSCLLLSLMNEIYCERGEVINDHQAIAYVPQVPFLFPGTIRENILFGNKFDPERYRKVIDACCLEEDFQMITGGDFLKVSDNNDLNLSGGQQARINIARALYNPYASLLLIDDALACLDAVLCSRISHSIVSSDITKEKTVIIVTSSQFIMDAADMCLLVNDDGLVVQSSSTDCKRVDTNFETIEEDLTNSIEERSDLTSISLEDRSTGCISSTTYAFYFSKQKVWIIMALLFLLLMQLSRNGADLWLSFHLKSRSVQNQTKKDGFIVGYIQIVILCSIFTLLRSITFAAGGLCSAIRIHDELLSNILNWHFVQFLSVSGGQIINRIISDVGTIDDSLPFILNIFLAQSFGIGGIILVLLISQERNIVPMGFILLGLYCWYRGVQRHYLACAREVKRLEAVYQSPIFSITQSSCDGSVIIRSFKKNDYFVSYLNIHLEAFQRAKFSSVAASAWLSSRLQLMSTSIASAIIALGLINQRREFGDEYFGVHSNMTTALVGLSLSYILPCTSLLSGLVTSGSETEREMVSVERVMAYFGDRSSSQVDTDDKISNVQESQPICGDIIFCNVFLSYPSSSQWALNNFSLHIPEQSRFAICGRSGSGKSTVLSCLLGLLPIQMGCIYFGATPVSAMRMRKKDVLLHIGYIPQQPVMFSASIRENLDPYGEYDDSVLLDCLRKTDCLKNFKPKYPSESILDIFISSSGLSVAEKAVFSLSRLLLRKPKYLCLDEPSSVLNSKDIARLFALLDVEFSGITVVETVHRLSRAMRADFVAIMSEGRVQEVGKPKELLSSDTEFSRMIDAEIQIRGN